MDPIKMMIIDDHEVFASLLAERLHQEANIQVLKVLTTVKQLIKSIESLKPDMLLMDVRIGEEDGLAWTKQLKKDFPQLKMILMSGFVMGHYAQDAGADAFFSKEKSPLILIDTINEVCVHDRHVFYIQGDARLTKAQSSVLRLLAKGCTNKEVSEELHISERTVNNQVTEIYSRLGVHSKAEAAVQAAKMGLI